MPGFLRRAQLYLGLGPDDEYEEYEVDDRPTPPREVAAVPAAPRPAPPRPAAPRPAGPTAARPRPAVPNGGGEPGEVTAVRPLPPQGGGEASAPKPKPVVRQVAANAKPSVVSPKSFNHAQEVADKFKASQPVIINLQGVDRELSRRLIDFSSGICYALGGHMEKVASHVYLLTPANVEVSAEERRRLQERGLADA